MKNLAILIIVAGIFVLSSCEKVDPDPLSQDEIALKSAKKVLNFRTHLSGANETVPTETMATGEAIFQLSKDGTELSYKLIVNNIENVRMSHIHVAPEGANGPIVVWLYPSAPPLSLIPGRFDGILAEGVITESNFMGPLTGMTMSDLVDAIYAGNTYVNVHTDQYPGGEIRGQIEGNMPGN